MALISSENSFLSGYNSNAALINFFEHLLIPPDIRQNFRRSIHQTRSYAFLRSVRSITHHLRGIFLE